MSICIVIVSVSFSLPYYTMIILDTYHYYITKKLFFRCNTYYNYDSNNFYNEYITENDESEFGFTIINQTQNCLKYGEHTFVASMHKF